MRIEGAKVLLRCRDCTWQADNTPAGFHHVKMTRHKVLESRVRWIDPGTPSGERGDLHLARDAYEVPEEEA